MQKIERRTGFELSFRDAKADCFTCVLCSVQAGTNTSADKFCDLDEDGHGVLQAAPSGTAASVESAWPEPTPVFLVLDGIEFGPTLDTVIRSGVAKVRTQDYLAPALKQAWGDKLDFYSVPWGGRLRDDDQLSAYISLSRAQLCRVVNEAAGRPVVVIGHSWGSVVGYQAIRALETQSCPGGAPLPSGAVDLFVSMGSPLGSDLIEQTVKLIPGDFPGQELLGKPIAKPSTVSRWVNIAVKNDLIASQISPADANLTWDAGPNAVLRPAPFAYTYAHSAYYSKQDLVDRLAETISGRCHRRRRTSKLPILPLQPPLPFQRS